MKKSVTAAKSDRSEAASPSADPRVRELLDALRGDPDLAASVTAFEASAREVGRKKFGSNGLKVNGKLFALFTQQTIVVKLPKARVAALVAAGVGTPFDPGHGRLMKEWLTVVSAKARWVELVREAHDFVGRPPAGRSSPSRN
jgi:hypothetical protein